MTYRRTTFKDIGIYGTSWEDLRFPATALNPPGQASDPDLETTTGFYLFAAAGTELLYIAAQMPHAWKEGTTIQPHVHWSKTTSAAGDVVWQLEYEIVPIAGTFAGSYTAISSSTPISPTPDNDTAGEHLITKLGDVSMTNQTLSCMIAMKLSRLGGDAADTYGADARLFEFDIHYQVDTFGSEAVGDKTPVITKG